nr:chloride channel protein [Streptomyces sp. TS71-3]
MATLRSTRYLVLLVFAGLLGVPLAAGAYGFLALVKELQHLCFAELPGSLGFHGEPPWWPLPLLAVAGLLVAAAIRFLPGTGGHEPSQGLAVSGAPGARELPGILLAALVSLALGAVIGPEAPLIALGGGVAMLAARLLVRGAGARAHALVAASGSFAAVSALLGSPLLGAFLLMEVVGIGGTALSVVLLPGLLSAGVGALVFVGFDSWTGLGTDTLSLPDLPPVGSPSLAELGWAIVVGLAAACAGAGVRGLAKALRARVAPRRLLLSPLLGLAVAALAIAYAQGSGRSSSEVLFSGQTDIGPLIVHAADHTVGALLLLLACKALAYVASLAAFRGGPVFPALFLGAAGGVLLSHLPGVQLVAGAAMGMGAMTAAMLGLPMTAVLLATLLMAKDGLTVMPVVIVAVVVSHVASIRLAPPRPRGARSAEAPAPAAG